mgnify:CR=1 FL=1
MPYRLGLTSREFLSTSSARRTTTCCLGSPCKVEHFYPRPPRGGRPNNHRYLQTIQRISIHVLREEDDRKYEEKEQQELVISIHVLREEDDPSQPYRLQLLRRISIHVLREEDDHLAETQAVRSDDISIHVLREEDDPYRT